MIEMSFSNLLSYLGTSGNKKSSFLFGGGGETSSNTNSKSKSKSRSKSRSKSKSKKEDDPFMSMGTGMPGYYPVSDSDTDSSESTEEDFLTASDTSSPVQPAYPSRQSQLPPQASQSQPAHQRQQQPTPTSTPARNPSNPLRKDDSLTSEDSFVSPDPPRFRYAPALGTITAPQGEITKVASHANSSSSSNKVLRKGVTATGLQTPPSSAKRPSSRTKKAEDLDGGEAAAASSSSKTSYGKQPVVPTMNVNLPARYTNFATKPQPQPQQPTPTTTSKTRPRGYGLHDDDSSDNDQEEGGYPITPTKAPAKKKEQRKAGTLDMRARESLASFTGSSSRPRRVKERAGNGVTNREKQEEEEQKTSVKERLEAAARSLAREVSASGPSVEYPKLEEDAGRSPFVNSSSGSGSAFASPFTGSSSALSNLQPAERGLKAEVDGKREDSASPSPSTRASGEKKKKSTNLKSEEEKVKVDEAVRNELASFARKAAEVKPQVKREEDLAMYRSSGNASNAADVKLLIKREEEDTQTILGETVTKSLVLPSPALKDNGKGKSVPQDSVFVNKEEEDPQDLLAAAVEKSLASPSSTLKDKGKGKNVPRDSVTDAFIKREESPWAGFGAPTRSAISPPSTPSTGRQSVKPEENERDIVVDIPGPPKRQFRRTEAIEQRKQWNNTLWGLATPEPSPAKPQPANNRSPVPSFFNNANAPPPFTFPAPEGIPQPKTRPSPGKFTSFPENTVPILRLTSTEGTFNNQSYPTYSADNGHVLRWYQARDLEKIIAETVTREVLRMRGDTLLEDVPQGRILGYQVGLGKTHVALCVIAETFKQLDVLYTNCDPKPPRRPVLIIAKLGLHQHWVTHAANLFGLEVFIYTAKGKKIPNDVDIIISNIDLTRNQHTRKMAYGGSEGWNAESDAPFFERTFTYLVVDEFHDHRNPETVSATSLLTLKADNILLLSGTIAQNKKEDLDVALNLLMHPSRRKNFLDAECAARMNRKKPKPDEVVHRYFITDELIGQTIISRNTDPDSEFPTITLPPLEILIVNIPLFPKEREAYYNVTRRYDMPLVRILRWRQSCLHPGLLKEVQDAIDDDPMDLDVKMDDVTRDYGDLDMDTNEDGLPDSSLSGVDESIKSDKYLSSKFRVALGILRDIKKKGEKTLIFSIFTSLLDILSECLNEHGFKHAMYNGSMKLNDREAALQAIATDSTCNVMLISIKAGGAGLNITSCNNVIIMDPWWNPYVEEQVIGRVHRIGQVRAVKVYRLISPDTIENRIQEVQERKRNEIESMVADCRANTARRDAALMRPEGRAPAPPLAPVGFTPPSTPFGTTRKSRK